MPDLLVDMMILDFWILDLVSVRLSCKHFCQKRGDFWEIVSIREDEFVQRSLLIYNSLFNLFVTARRKETDTTLQQIKVIAGAYVGEIMAEPSLG
jgi:hypothetical protein